MEAAKADPARFAPLYERYYARVYDYCLRRVRSREEAEDLASVVFTLALAGGRDFRGRSVAAWIFRITHHAVANHLRDRRAHASLDRPPVDLAAEGAAPEEATIEHMVAAEERGRVARLIAALPEDERALLALKVAGGLTAREIGEVLGKREGAVRVALHRVIQHLRERYRQQEEGR
jgi:RNA polymerase sigma-70 factor (ECF subfamily)